MIEILKYSTSGFCIFCGCYALIGLILYFVVNGVLKLISRILRTIMVSIHGWPPSHLDADGDFKTK